jgi:hypothetical protein
LGIISLQRIEQEFLQQTLVKVAKLRLLDEMVHHSRQRSVLLRDLVIANDPFDQDEITQLHSALAGRYLSARNELAEQPLNKEERKILDHIIELNSNGYAVQQQIIKLATTERQDEALELIATELGPNREMIYPDMMKMRELLVESSNLSYSADLVVCYCHLYRNWYCLAGLSYRFSPHSSFDVAGLP